MHYLCIKSLRQAQNLFHEKGKKCQKNVMRSLNKNVHQQYFAIYSFARPLVLYNCEYPQNKPGSYADMSEQTNQTVLITNSFAELQNIKK